MPAEATKVTVSSRLGRCTGHRIGNVATYVWHGPDKSQRLYLLLDKNIQLQQPGFFRNPDHADWWYADVVSLAIGGTTITVRDLYIDFVIPPIGPDYRIIDLDDLASAMRSGAITTEEAAQALDTAQRFADAHLQGRGATPQGFPDFPPKALELFGYGWREMR